MGEKLLNVAAGVALAFTGVSMVVGVFVTVRFALCSARDLLVSLG